jgi:hypothetical protein
MTISTLILVLLLTFGAASALDRKGPEKLLN